MKTIYRIIGLFVCLSRALEAAEIPTVRLKVEVASSEGDLVEGAEVGVGSYSTPKGKYPYETNGRTDARGVFVATINSFGEVAAFARRSGYYDTDTTVIRLGDRAAILGATERGRWEPWERTIKVVLKPIKNPVPMYAKGIRNYLPAAGKALGYDLEKGDWVAPYGKGEKVDCEFTHEAKNEVNNLNYSGKLVLRFIGQGNGIQSHDRVSSDGISALKMPYAAPVDGYVSSWTWENARITEEKPHATSRFVGEMQYGRGFFFRVRAVVDADGKIISAWYGKINGPVDFDSRGHGFVNFGYHLNPDTTRNVEFDPKRNLFTNLRHEEGMAQP